MTPAIPVRPLDRAYDHIVVGAGSGGSVVARRLVDGSDASVLLIEAGGPGIGIEAIDHPPVWPALWKGPYDWGYDYAPAPRANDRVIAIPRGKVLGGSSSINAMMWYRGNALDYDDWAAAGATGWSFADCLPYFRRAEDWEGGADAFRGVGGPLRIERTPVLHPIAEAMIEGAADIGIPPVEDPNGADNAGAARANFNISGNRRWSAARGYLWPVLQRPTLTVLTGSLAIGLIIEHGRCVGVRHLVEGVVHETRATAGVTLALGAIDTPRLLMLSGIGDPAELRRLGLPVVAALPGVGRNLQDHPLITALNFRSKRPLGPPVGNGGGAMLNWRSMPGLSRPDLHAFIVQGPSFVPGLDARYDLTGDMFSIGVGLMHSRSIGALRMLEARPGGRLEIQPNLLDDPTDMAALAEGVRAMLDLVETPAFADHFAGHAAPARRPDAAGIAAFVREACSTFFHTCGTAAMGTGEMAVVDPLLRVRGVEGLTIADASVIPVIPTCNTHAPVTMIAERAAEFLLGVA